ncbi:MAG: PBP1A family penicillin-binding protein [Thermodesulfovibrionales bacterium]|nr:PBP1A family penicillin-binding protein [Thermodesulfovibrionales bacterium]
MKRFLLLIILVLLLGSIVGAYFALAEGIPAISELRKYRYIEGTKVYADDDTLIGEFKIDKGIYVTYEKFPPHLINAVVAVEDSRFWTHKGIDYIGIARALITDILHASIKQGGSTITQQLAKIMFLSPEKTLKRKIKEAHLAIKLEKELSKKEILELYLNKVYFGHGAYGIEMASRLYFGKSVSQINLPEAALLAGLIKAPNAYSPFNNLIKAKERQEVVLARMEAEGYITSAQRENYKRHPIVLSSLRFEKEANNYFLEYIRQQLEQKYGEDIVYKKGLKVYTTLNKNAQISAQRALQEGLREIDKRKGWRGPIGYKELKSEPKDIFTKPSISITKGEISTGIVLSVNPKEAIISTRGITGRLSLEDSLWASNVLDVKTGKNRTIKNFKLTDILKRGDVIYVKVKSVEKNNITLSLEQDPEIEGALVAIDPETGYIKAMIGGFSFSKSDYNRALMAKRQPGSAFKPFVYAVALQNGYTPESIIVDEPVTYKWGNKEWSPENYDHKYLGPTTLREALAYSRNVVTVKLVDSVGIDNVRNFALKAGIQTDIPRELSIALGSISVTPLELTSAYSAFANNGIKYKPIAIRYITDSKGTLLEENLPQGEQILSPEVVTQLTSMLKDVILYGTGMRANIGRSAAGKTGTTNDYRDAWFIGYTHGLVAGVWVGYDDMRRSLGQTEVGGRAAAPIWASFMKSSLSDISTYDLD